MKVNFYDTSALLLEPELAGGHNIISPLVISELENIKNSKTKDDHIKYLARKVVRKIISRRENNWDFISVDVSQRKVDKLLRKYKFLSNINDHRILCEALVAKREYFQMDEFHFITADAALYLFAQQFSELNSIYLEEKKEEPWTGWGKYYPKEHEMEQIYSNKSNNILKAKINEYCEIHEGSELKDILRWDGSSYKNLNYQQFRTPDGQKINPRNTEQKMLFDLLQNRSIPVKLCLGRFGAGKSFLMLAHALHLIQKGEFDKIVFVKNNIEVKDTKAIGALPGSEIEKLQPFIQQIADHVGQLALEDMIEQNVLEPIHLGFIRGRDIKNSIIYCDEVENMTKQHIQLLLGRVSTGSELWLAGDTKQIDAKIFEQNSGIISLIDSLSDDPLFGMVKLIKSERSAVAALADKLD